MSNRHNRNGMHRTAQPMNQGIMDLPVDSLPSFHCRACGGHLFNEVFELYEVSALVSPTGQPAPIKLPLFLCVRCGLSTRTEEMTRMLPHERDQLEAERAAQRIKPHSTGDTA